MPARPMSEHGRLMAWKTRRAKYGPKGHAASYARPRVEVTCDRCRGLLDLVIRLHRGGTLSEGQVAKASGLDRVTVRSLVCDQSDVERKTSMGALGKRMILHALGLSRVRRWSYRNYVAGCDETCAPLVECGYMACGRLINQDTQPLQLYHVTDDGAAAAGVLNRFRKKDRLRLGHEGA